MANEKDSELGNFSIESTMDMGLGNQELLSDLYASETSTANPDEIKKIETTAPVTKKKSEAPVKKKEETKKEDEEEEDETSKKSLASFLTDEDEEEERQDEEEEDSSKKDKKKAPKKEEEDNNQEEQEDEEGEEDSSAEKNQFEILSKELYKLGVFTKGEDEEDAPEVKTAEEFLERFNFEKKKGAIETIESFIGQFGEDYKNAFEAIYVKGVDPKEYFSTYNKIQNFAELDLASEENQLLVIRQALQDQGFEEDDVKSELERLKNYGDLEAVAQKHHKVLIKKEAAKLQQLEQENQVRLQEQRAQKQKYAANVTAVLQEKIKAKEFDGIPLSPKIAGELQDFLLVEKWKTPSGETLTDFDRTILDLKRPENHAMKVKVALILKTLEKDPTLSTIQKAGITKKSDQLFGDLVITKSGKESKSDGSGKKVKSAYWSGL